MKQFGCLIAALAVCLAAPGQLRINGKDIVYDALARQWLCTVPDSCFGSDYEATITIRPESGWDGVVLDGQPVVDGQPVTLASLDGVTPHQLTVTVADSTVSGRLLFSCLPLLEVNAQLSTAYRSATMVLHLPDGTAPQRLQGRIKWRGRTTLMPGRNKRNFHIKLEDGQGQKLNLRLLGLREDNSWLLDGGQIDLSRVRNHVAQELWLDMAAKPYYADLEPKARSGIRGDQIELFVNGQYEGIYTLSEAMDRKQMKLVKYETDPDLDSHIIHGQLWKSIDYGRGSTFDGVDPYDNTLETWMQFETKYPELEEVCPTDYSVLHDAIKFTAEAYDSKWRRLAHEYFDLPVIRDYIIFAQVMLAIDNAAKNLYWAVYDREQDKKLTLAVWDLDCTVGQDWTNTPFRPQDRVGPERKWTPSSNVMGRLRVLIDDFRRDMVRRYHQLRQGPLHTDSITARYVDHIDRLIFAGAAARESARWDGDSDLGGRNLDWEGEKTYISDWLDRRLRFLDVTAFDQSGITEVTADDIPAPDTGTYNLLGQKMPDGVLPPGIYVRAGRKIIVRR